MIEGYQFGWFSLFGKEYTSDVIIYGDEVTPWWREESHSVSRKDIEPLVADKPATVVIGSGAYGMMDVPNDTRRFVESNGMTLIVKKTGEAVDEFNRLRAQGADVAIAMHLTC